MKPLTVSPSDPNHFLHAKEVAKTLAMSQALPPHFRGKPAEVFFALQTAFDLGISPLMAMQNLYMVQGRMGMSATLAIALCNTNGPFLAPLRWETDRSDPDNLSVTCVGILDATDPTEARVDLTVDMNQARADGWVKNPKYKTIPEQMLKYRSAVWFIRLYAPEVLLGLQSSDELVDTHGLDSNPGLSPRAAELNQLAEADMDEPQEPAPRVIEVDNAAPKADTDAKRTKTQEEVEEYVSKAFDNDRLERQEAEKAEAAAKVTEETPDTVDPSEIHGELFD